MKFRTIEHGWDTGRILAVGAVALSHILGWILLPHMGNFWLSQAGAMVLWTLLQMEWFSFHITKKENVALGIHVTSSIAVAISWITSIIFLNDDHIGITLIGLTLILSLLLPLLWLGYRASTRHRGFLKTLTLALIPALTLGAAGAWLWKEGKEMAALSKIHRPVFSAKFEGAAPIDPYWTRQMAGFAAVPDEGFTWEDAVTATNHLGDDTVKPGDLKPIYTPKNDARDTDYTYVKRDLFVHAIGVSLDGSYQEEAVKSPDAVATKRIKAYSAFNTEDQFSSDARRAWFYTSYPKDAILQSGEIDISGAKEDMPRTYALVQGWKKAGLSDEAMVDRALEYFSNNLIYHFDYQIKNFREEKIDHFLFTEKKGVCEQFANTFVRMMKVAGIPARMVSGFRGGDIDTQTGEMIVRVRNAHAWAEVWIEGRGWVRVDPTDAVPVEEGVPDFGNTLMGQMLNFSSFDFDGGISGGEIKNEESLRGRAFRWVTDNAVWVLIPAMLAMLIALLIMRRRHKNTDEMAREDIAWERLRSEMSGKGYDADVSMGPRTLSQAVAIHLPEGLRVAMGELAARYEGWKYASQNDPHLARDIKRFQREVPKPRGD